MDFILEDSDTLVIVRYPDTGQIAFRHDGDMDGAMDALEGVAEAMGFTLCGGDGQPPEAVYTPDPDLSPDAAPAPEGDVDTDLSPEGQGVLEDPNPDAEPDPDGV